MKIPRIIISAPSSGQGKTTLSIGLMLALVKRGLRVQPYKIGPDYIDPAFHTSITNRNSINLDNWLLDEDYIKQLLITYSQNADISVIEGVMGLYDGKSTDPMKGSTAGMSVLLDTPVILVMEAKGMSTSAGALVHGYKSFGNIDIRAVVINKPSSDNHYNTVKNAIEKNTGVKVLGFLPKSEDIELKSRHLGLVQCCETDDLKHKANKLSNLIEDNIDVDGLIKIASSSSSFNGNKIEYIPQKTKVKIAVARDSAFNFYYWENLQILERMGAEMEFFSPISDNKLPKNCCGIYLGGGYPEIYAKELHENKSIRQDIFEAYKKQIPIYAECGGFMYLNKGINISDKSYDFVGIFEGLASMTKKLQNFGYADVEVEVDNFLLSKGDSVRVHEFHKSVINRTSEDYGVKVTKEKNGKKTEWHCGMFRKNVFAMYPHIYFPSNIKIADNFYKNCLEYCSKFNFGLNKVETKK